MTYIDDRFQLLDDDDEVLERLPTRMEVCPRCHGRGSHVNPSIDGNGISADDECWQDDDFREMYFGGGYDVTCERCQGRNVVEVLDEDRIEPQVLAQWEAQERERYECDQISRMERMMGA